jgi:hypothetical protein
MGTSRELCMHKQTELQAGICVSRSSYGLHPPTTPLREAAEQKSIHASASFWSTSMGSCRELCMHDHMVVAGAAEVRNRNQHMHRLG